jgi:hypothetical protein
MVAALTPERSASSDILSMPLVLTLGLRSPSGLA